MAMGKRKEVEQPLFLITSKLAQSLPHPFYRGAQSVARKSMVSIASWSSSANGFITRESGPAVATPEFNLCSLIGYFEGIDLSVGSPGVAVDSLSLRMFLSVPLDGNSRSSDDLA